MKWNKLAPRPLNDEEKELYPYCDFIWDGQQPSIDEDVLVCVDGKEVYTDVWVEYSDGVGFDVTDVEEYAIIYWMSFPEPPKKESKTTK